MSPVEAFSRIERFGSIGSTNDVVRGWLADGTPEICVATADEQTAGRGRSGRTWVAPPGSSLLASLGFRPSWLRATDTWRLAALMAMAMADAAEDQGGMAEGTIRLKWPNDLVVIAGGSGAAIIGDLSADAARDLQSGPIVLRKLAGVLGETDGLGTADPRAVIGIGLNTDWSGATVPAELAGSMTTLHEASGGRPIDRAALLDAFLTRLETRIGALRGGRFDVAGWADRQVTTGHLVTISTLGSATRTYRALGVDGASGGLMVEVIGSADGASEHLIHAGEVQHLRLAPTGEV
ncbi:MAG: biotin--[acetyl-CoA-carboxylase] ligase [Chloroflexota bacterium]